MKRQIFLSAIILLTLTGCANVDKSKSYYCEHITQQLQGGAHRHNAGRKLTPIGEARLMKQYQKYHCDG